MAVDWNTAYAEGDTPWDKGAPAPPLREFLDRQPVRGRILVPGCGSGHDVRLLAALPETEVVGLDVAPLALEAAEAFPKAGAEVYEKGDFLELPASHHERYDWIAEHTCLCALDPVQREAYARSAAKALKPGGRFVGVFFREVPDYDGEGPPHPISGKEIESLFNPHFVTEDVFTPTRVYPERPVGCEEVRLFRKRG